MIEFVGNCKNFINWNDVIDQLTHKTPSKMGPFHNTENLDYVLKICKENSLLLKENQGTVGWDIFLPHVDFDMSIVEKFAEYLNVDSYTDAWITRLTVGMMILPFKEFNSDGNRWHCHVSGNEWGHVMFIDNKPLHSQDQGNVYKWSSKNLTYAANNVGSNSQYFFNFY